MLSATQAPKQPYFKTNLNPQQNRRAPPPFYNATNVSRPHLAVPDVQSRQKPLNNAYNVPQPAATSGRYSAYMPMNPVVVRSESLNDQRSYELGTAGRNLSSSSSLMSGSGSSSGFSFDDDISLFDMGVSFDERVDDLFAYENVNSDPLSFFPQDEMRYQPPQVRPSEDIETNSKDLFLMEPEVLTPTTNVYSESYSFNPFQSMGMVDFTPFLERLQTTDRDARDSPGLREKMMMLIAKYFHDRITMSKNNMNIYGNLNTYVDNTEVRSKVTNLSSHGTTRVLCKLEFDSSFKPEIIRRFLNEAEWILGYREDLKIALRALLPPTMSATSYENPFMGFAPRKRKRSNAIFEHLLGKDDSKRKKSSVTSSLSKKSLKSKKPRKRGRPRKNTIGSSECDASSVANSSSVSSVILSSSVGSVKGMKQTKSNSKAKQMAVQKEKNGKLKSVKNSKNSVKLKSGEAATTSSKPIISVSPENKRTKASRNIALDSTKFFPPFTSNGLMDSRHNQEVTKLSKTKKRRVSLEDDEWMPEYKKQKSASRKISEKEKAEPRKIKVKSPSDKAKEEAELISMGVVSLENYISTMQQQMRNIKHKHRKGTVCPRCTTEQRIKVAFKAKTKIQTDSKPSKEQVIVKSDPPKVAVNMNNVEPALKHNVTPKQQYTDKKNIPLVETPAATLSQVFSVVPVMPQV